MANTFEDYTVSTSTSLFNITFEYLEEAHIVVEIDGVIQATSTYSIVAGSPNKVSLNTPVTSGVVRIRRDSNADSDAPFVDFVNGSVLTETDLDKSYRHNLYLNEEIGNLNQQSLQKQAGANPEVWDAKTLKVVNVADPTLVQDAVTKSYVDTQISNTVTGSSTLPVKTTFTGAGSATFTFSAGITLATAEAYEVAIDGVLQEPTTAYTLDADANTITFTSTPPTGSNIVVVQRGYSVPVTSGVITTSNIQDNAVTDAKLASGVAMTSSERTKLSGIATSANNYTHPNHTGDVTSTADGATVIADGAVTSSKISTSDANFNVSAGGNTGIGTTASGSYKLSVNGDVIIQDTSGDNTPALIMAGTTGAILQLNDQSTNGQVFNISSNPDSAARGGFGIGHISTAGTPITTVSHVNSTTTATTFQTSTAHGLKEGQYVVLSGSSGDWNGNLEVIEVVTTTQFKVPKLTTSTAYPTTVTPNDTLSTFSIRRHEESNVLYNMIKLLGLPQDTSEPSWLEDGQLWIDTTDNTLKIKPEVHS